MAVLVERAATYTVAPPPALLAFTAATRHRASRLDQAQFLIRISGDFWTRV